MTEFLISLFLAFSLSFHLVHSNEFAIEIFLKLLRVTFQRPLISADTLLSRPHVLWRVFQFCFFGNLTLSTMPLLLSPNLCIWFQTLLIGTLAKTVSFWPTSEIYWLFCREQLKVRWDLHSIFHWKCLFSHLIIWWDWSFWVWEKKRTPMSGLLVSLCSAFS